MTDSRAGAEDELFLMNVLRNPIAAVDSALRTGAAAVPAVIDALRAIPRIATAMEKLVPALQATQGSLDRLDRLGMFVAQELPVTQHQLEELRKQLVTVSGVNRTLNESIRVLSRGLGVVRSVVSPNSQRSE
jgi:hypothetical protein